MGLFERKTKREEFVSVINSEPAGDVYQTVKNSKENFSTPFLPVGKGNLSLPYINNNFEDARGYVRFGNDNLFPQLINQLYYTSPLNGSIIEFKTNSISGGGYEITLTSEDAKAKARKMVFENRSKIKKTYRPITRDLIQHNRAYFLLQFDVEQKMFKKASRIAPEKVRISKGKKKYFICEDWSTQINVKPIDVYRGKIETEFYILPYELDSVGQDEYSIPSYSSAFNWAFLDGEMSYLHKSNIQNSIFPAFALLFPKKPNSDQEKREIKQTIESAKGAPNAGRIFALFANNAEQLPKIENIPANNNDKLFEQTDERIDAQLCKAHCIDPLLLGIRVSGKLGSGNELDKSYTIYEKNTVIPFREHVEEFFNELLKVARINGKFELINYQIVNEEIIEKDDSNKIYEQLSKLSPLVVNKVLESLTLNEIRQMGGAGRVNGGDKVAPPQAQQNQNIPIQ
jgi:hypothetical protein